MSRHAVAWQVGLAAALLLVAVARNGRAQTQAEYRARIQQLVPLWKAEVALEQHDDSVRAHALPVDTVRMSGITVLADTGLEALARNSAGQAAAELGNRFGDAVRGIQTSVFVLTRSDQRMLSEPTVVTAEADARGNVVRGSYEAPTVDAVAESWATRGSLMLTAALGPEFGRWLGNAIPVHPATTGDWVGVRIDLVTSSFEAARTCYGGDIRGCEHALGILDADDPVRSWFTAAERRLVVLRDGYQLQRLDPDQYQQCAVGKDDAACLGAGAMIPVGDVAPPLGPDARQSLARLAMDIGGAGAFDRMRQAPDSIGARLQAAARIPLDSLVRRWRAIVVGTEAAHTTMTPGLALMSLFWVATCGTLALRSSRWR